MASRKPKNRPRRAPRARRVEKSFAPVAIGSVLRASTPRFGGSGDTIRVSHRAFFKDVNSDGVDFDVTRIRITPGNNEMFPWAAPLAALFESWRIVEMKIHYVPTCPTSTPGRVSLAVDYDAVDASPLSRGQLLSYEGAASAARWAPFTIKVNTKSASTLGRWRYCAPATNSATGEDRLTDAGVLLLATSGTEATFAGLGELWLDYIMEFCTPQMVSPEVLGDYGYIKFEGSVTDPTRILTGMGHQSGVLWGVARELIEGHVTGGVAFERAGKYLMELDYSGSGFSGVPNIEVVFSNATDTSATAEAPLMNNTGTYTHYETLLDLKGAGGHMNVDLSGILGTVGEAFVTLTRISTATYAERLRKASAQGLDTRPVSEHKHDAGAASPDGEVFFGAGGVARVFTDSRALSRPPSCDLRRTMTGTGRPSRSTPRAPLERAEAEYTLVSS